MSRTHQIRTGLATALALGAIAAPAASAQPLDPGPVQATTPIPTPVTVHVVRDSSSSGFDWGDAGIGGAAVLVLTMLGVGGTLATRRSTPAT